MPPKKHKRTEFTSPKKNEPKLIIDNLMTVAAFRYCLGRASYIVSHCVDYLSKHWEQIPVSDKKLIHKEIQGAFDSESYGMEMDKEQWQKVLDLKI